MNADRAILAAVAAGVLVLYTAVVFAFFGAQPEDRVLYLALLGIPIAVGFFAAPRLWVFILGMLVYSVDWLNEFWMVIPREATWVTDILLVLFAVRYAVTFFFARHKVFAAEIAVISLLVFSLISALLNGETQATTLIGIRVAFRYLFLFLAIASLPVSEASVRKFMGFFVIIALIQIPVVIWQRYYWDFASGDDMYGTFGRSQTGGLALFILIVYGYVIARAIEYRRLGSWSLIFLFALAICPILGEAKMFFLLLPIFLMFMFRSEFFRRPALFVLFLIFGLIVVVAADYVIVQTGMWREGRNPLTFVTKLQGIFEQELEGPQPERLERTHQYVNAIRLAADNSSRVFFGNGPGSITHSFVAERHSRTAEYFEGFGLNSTSISVPWMLTEYGYGGSALMFFLVYLIYRRGRHLRAHESADIRVHGRTLEAISFLYVVWLFYQPAWQSDQMNYDFWAPAGMMVALSYQVARKRKRLDDSGDASLSDIAQDESARRQAVGTRVPSPSGIS